MGDRIEVDRDEWEATQRRLRDLEERMERVDRPASAVVVPAGPGGVTSRRKALLGMAAAGVGAAGLVAGQAAPAAANGQGQSWTLGDATNTASATTGVTAGLAGAPAVSVRNTSAQRAILGVAGSPSGNGGTAAIVGDAAATDGVFGLSGTGRGVAAISTNGAAVAALAVNGTGIEVTAGATGVQVTAGGNGIQVTSGAATDISVVRAAAVVAESNTRSAVVALSGREVAVSAESRQGAGVEGRSRDDYGVRGFSQDEAGVRGISNSGFGVWGSGAQGGVLGTSALIGVEGTGDGNNPATTIGVRGKSATGRGLYGEGRFPLHIHPSTTSTPPAGGTAGDIWMSNAGVILACLDGIRWQVIAGRTAAGAFHVLPAPARVYDSRPGTAPTGVGPKTKFAANETRTLDLKANGSTVPAGATAALVTILLVNASTTPGNATIWANGRAKPQANTMVWGGTAGRFTATATTAVDDIAQIWFNASQTTDLVLDVVGYYR